VIEKVKETYGLNNHIVFPHENRPAGRPVRTTPIYEKLKARGCDFGFHYGWETPNWFSLTGPPEYKPSFQHTNWFEPVREEVRNLCTGVGIMDLSAFSKLIITGKDSKNFLLRMCANNLPKHGKAVISHMLTPKGKLYAELTITRTGEDSFYVVTGSGMERHDLRWLLHHKRSDEDVRIDVCSESYNVLGVVGPKSREVLQKLTMTDMSDEAFKFLDSKTIDLGRAAQVNATRISFTGELGWEIHLKPEYTSGLYDALLDVGKEFGIIDFGAYAQNSLRLEKGFRLLGTDMTKDHSALAAGLVGRFVKLNRKSDFIGKQALIEEQEAGGPRQLSVALTMNTDSVNSDPHGNEPLFDKNDNLVGYTTSGGYGYNLGCSIAYGYLNKELTTPGTELFCEILGKKCAAVVAQEPLMDTEPARVMKAKKKVKN